MYTQTPGNTVREIKYVPRSIGSSRPMGGYANEFVVFADSLQTWDKFSIHIKTWDTDQEIDNPILDSGRDQEWACLFIADFQGANQSPLELSSKLKELGGVTDVSYASRKKSTLGFFSFPVLMNDKSEHAS
jgi:hypothetical protein